MRMLAFALLITVLLCFAYADSGLKIPTTSGIMMGKRYRILDKPGRLFLGIPYAHPPINDLRFKPPIALYSDDIERDATRFAPSCYQPPHLNEVISPLLNPNKAEISEDCLYLNVYIPDFKNLEDPLPVMIWLPGEGFDFADPQQYEGGYLAIEGNVIVVTVNYRLSAFGFLSSLTDEAPGNVGLLDQRLALKWVKSNIANFGGNSENVTLFGRFSGSMSVAIHAFSPLTKEERLFQRIILHSGIPVGDWAFDRKPLNATFALAEATNCIFQDISDVIACLRRQPADILLSSALSIPTRWRPIYDYKLIYEDTLKSVAKMSKINIDIIIGMNNDEGTLCTIALKAMKSPFYTKLVEKTLTEEDLNELIQENTFAFFKYPDSFLNMLTAYKYKNSKKAMREIFVEFCGDLQVTAHNQKLADEIAKKNGNIFMYEFSHRPSFSIHPSFIRAGHGDDILFSMGLPFKMIDLPAEEAHLTKRMVAAVTNFARNGNPNTKDSEEGWPKYSLSNPEIYSFSTYQDKVKGKERRALEDAKIYWHTIVPAAQKRNCGQSPSQSLLPEAQKSQLPDDSFCRQYTQLPFADYALMGLICVFGIFFLLTIFVASWMIKVKTSAAFQKLS